MSEAAERARARFAEIAKQRDEQIDLAEASLWLAAEAYPELVVERYLARIDALADELRTPVQAALEHGIGAAVDALNDELFGRRGFAGAHLDYYNPANSFLNEVLNRRLGIPITLSVLYIEIARRVGLDAEGISFPGHFLTRVRARKDDPKPDHASTEILVDAFEATVVTRPECEERLRAMLGPDGSLPADTGDLYGAATHRQILLRMLTNLKSIYASQGDLQAALGCCDRSLLLSPDLPQELRDRGLIYQSLRFARPALRDLERYLALVPDADSAANQPIRQLVAGLRRNLPPIH